MATTTTKLDKHELKQPDEFVSWGTRAAHYAAENAFLVLGGVVVSLLLIASVFGWMHNRGEREVEASQALYAGEKMLKGDMKGMAQLRGLGLAGLSDPKPEELKKAIAEFDKVASDYAGTKTARRAKALAGDTYMELEDWDNAAKSYEQAVGGTPIEKYYAISGMGHAYEAKGAHDQAAGAYRRLADDAQATFRDVATLDLARVLAASGKQEEAKTLLADFANDFPDSALKTQAATKLAALGGTPAPAKAPDAPAAAPGAPADDGHGHAPGEGH